jgi:hypothetical protein
MIARSAEMWKKLFELWMLYELWEKWRGLPANRSKGKVPIQETPESVAEYLEKLIQ